MKNGQILLLDQELPNINPPNMNGWFNYAVQETIQMAASKAISIRDVISVKGDMLKYQDELNELQEKYAVRDEYDKPIKHITPIGSGRQYEVFEIKEIDNPEGEFNVALAKLDEKYKEAIEDYKNKLKFLDEENPNFEPLWIEPKMIPDGLTRNQMKAIILMIKKPEPKA